MKSFPGRQAWLLALLALYTNIAAQVFHGTLGIADFHTETNFAALPEKGRQSQAAPAFSSPQAGLSFFALDDINNRIPPDTMGAVGPNHVMTALNTQVRVQTKTGSHISTKALSDFWSSLGSVVPFDPKLCYDPLDNRWIFAACANPLTSDSALLLGVSATSDPTGNWFLYKIVPPDSSTNFIDFPTLGFNRRWIVVQAPMQSIEADEFIESHIYVFNKTNLYVNGDGSYTLIRASTIGEVQAPAVTLDSNAAQIYLTSFPDEGGIGSQLNLFEIDGALGAETLRFVTSFNTPDSWAAEAPADGNILPQNGSGQKIHAQQSFRGSAVFRNGTIWATHHIFLPAVAPTRSAVQWWQCRTNALLQRGRLEDTAGSCFYAYPSIAVNRVNDVLIGCSRFSTNEFASAVFAVRAGSDPTDLLRSEVVFKAGEGVYFKTRGTGKNRWGDYSAACVDPEDDLSFWTIQEYAAAPVGDPALDDSGRWGTWWAKVKGPIPVFRFVSSSLLNGSQMKLRFVGPLGIDYQIEAATSLLNPQWQNVFQGTVVAGTNEFSEAFSSAAPARFYRLRAASSPTGL